MNVNGYLMHKDTIIGEIKNSHFFSINESFTPLFLKRDGSIETWLENRAIDRHRPHSRLLKRVLRMSNYDDIETVLKYNAATITDNYWIKGNNEKITYKDIRFSVNYFDQLALMGNPDSLERIANLSQNDMRTPELTNIGSFEKCWKLEGGKWWLYKVNNSLESFSELFIAEMGKQLAFDMAEYQKWENGTKSLDFTQNATMDFEPAYQLVGDEIDYPTNYDAIKSLSPAMGYQYLDLLACDALFFNMDRHTNNYGFLRDSDTGEYLKLAPNFDNNIALVANGYPSEVSIKRKNDIFINDFLDLLDYNGVNYELPVLFESDIDRLIDQIGIPVDGDIVKAFVLNGYERLIQELPLRQIDNDEDFDQ